MWSLFAKARLTMAFVPHTLAGLYVPSDSPLFLALLGIHVIAALAALVAGIVAMLSTKRSGRHPRFGTVYYWCLGVVFLTATGLAIVRWSEDAYLFFLGAGSFSAGTLARGARRGRWHWWVPIHISGMGLSYTLMVIAFYMDNGKQLPVWKDLPSITYWAVPSTVGVPLIAWALFRYRGIPANIDSQVETSVGEPERTFLSEPGKRADGHRR